ncbi:peptidoglycan DD-metalloendopeptidase family protein [Ornithinibacillus salinisoli]|uniref:Peptidoglycan DD-metalloendopeptidase family protein n=1 Tax=Ornithinibacillus salinisoli TaxID=1848459 RepID=A0ABW4W2W6_9BACI
MRRKKHKLGVLTFTILSNDANKVVTRFQIPRIAVFIMCIMAIIPIVFLAYFMVTSMDQQQENERLATALNQKTSKAEDLQIRVDQMEEKTTEVEQKMAELNELESQLQEYITDLPINEEPSGGIDVPVSKADIKDGQDELILTYSQSSELIGRYKDTLAKMDEVNEELKYIPTIWPTIPDKITSDFGLRSDPINRTDSLHTGIDIRGNFGTPVYATAGGTVIKAEYYGGYGNTIMIRHSNAYQTIYGHLSEIKVEQGDKVKKGELIGSIGSTGRSTGPHLHYEIVKHGEPVDPNTYLNISDISK